MEEIYHNAEFRYKGREFHCKELFYESAKQGKGKFRDKKDEIVSHVERVAKMCGEMADRLKLTGEKKQRVQNAAWLHDIGKSLKDEDDRKNHHLEKNVRKAVAKALEDDKSERRKIRKALKDNPEFCALTGIIAAHKPGEPLPETCQMESAILRMCDKIDKYNKVSGEEAGKSYERNLKEMEQMLDKDQFKRFKDVCEKIKNDVITMV